MKKKCLISLLFILPLFASSQAGEWVWLRGDSTPGSTGNFGIQGVASPMNEPPGIDYASRWTDLDGNLWIFGGLSPDNYGLSDLWKYDVTTNEWKWMKGNAILNDTGNYGIQGVASPTNLPPSRVFSPATWTDKDGNLWLFGGVTALADYCNDLWKYDIKTNEWTWVKGSRIHAYNNIGYAHVYGIKGIADSSNFPSQRAAMSGWTDKEGDLWLWGGWNQDTKYGTAAYWNEWWKYNIASNTWTWMQGDTTRSRPGVYGSLGVEDSLNEPPGKEYYNSWTDTSGNFWIFGGSDSLGLMNDFWRYNPLTNYWTWMGGLQGNNKKGIYGTKGVASANNIPGARQENRTCWTDENNNLWLFGGNGLSRVGQNYCNDLWMYSTASNEWTWVGGDTILNPQGTWGKQGVYNPSNQPNGRWTSVGWVGKNCNMYLWGGYEYVSYAMNDLWRYTIDPSICSNTIVPSFQSSDSIICSYDCINFNDLTSNATSWQWLFPGAVPSSSIDENPQSICYNGPGNFNVTLIASNKWSIDTLKINSLIRVGAEPPAPIITQSGDTLFCSFDSSYTSYQWYEDSTIIAGGTSQKLLITHNGNYNVRVANENGCSSTFRINAIITIVSLVEDNNPYINAYPNPAKNMITIVSQALFSGTANISIENVLGQRIYEGELVDKQMDIDLTNISSGLYIVKVSNEKTKSTIKFLRE